MHLIGTLEDRDKINHPTEIDKFYKAEIPDKEEDQELYNLVVKNMIHGPCGIHNPNAQCMNNGKCTKRFPKDFQEETQINDNGYPSYKRPHNGRTITKKVGNTFVELDNRWVVPYNAYLLKKYNCHINVRNMLIQFHH